jgi:hypothetical protein
MLGMIFSRDRAMQLDGTLRSFFMHCIDPDSIDIYVIYLATDDLNTYQYDQLAREYSNSFIQFIPQDNFRMDVLTSIIEQNRNKPLTSLDRCLIRCGPRFSFISNLSISSFAPQYVLFLVDDTIFIRDFSLCEARNALESSTDALGFSLRLGKNINYCYPLDMPQSIPICNYISDGVVKFDWTKGEYDFGYPLEVSSSIYRLDDIIYLLNGLDFKNPNTMESSMASSAHRFVRRKPYLLCYAQSVAFCNPANKVQTECNNRACTSSDYSNVRLAKMFNEGYRIDVDIYSDLAINACHQEVELIFKKVDNSQVPKYIVR